jgi:hypothetical protein
MALRLDDSEEILIKKWPVVVSSPKDGGGVSTNEILVDFALLPQDELDTVIEASRDGDGGGDANVLRRVVKSVSGIEDADGKAIDYSDDLLNRLLKRPNIRSAMMTAYFDAVIGKKGKRKN